VPVLKLLHTPFLLEILTLILVFFVYRNFVLALEILILFLFYSDDNSLWIGTGSSRKLFYFSAPKALQKVAIERNKLKIKSSFNIMVYNIAMTSDNDLLVVTDGPRLKQINSKTGILEDSKYSVDPALQPTFVHITRDNSKVIIGLCGIRRKYAVLIVKIVIGYPELFKIKSLWLSQHDTIMLSNGVVTMFRLQRSCSKMFTKHNRLLKIFRKLMRYQRDIMTFQTFAIHFRSMDQNARTV
jgi:hypothetical protein